MMKVLQSLRGRAAAVLAACLAAILGATAVDSPLGPRAALAEAGESGWQGHVFFAVDDLEAGLRQLEGMLGAAPTGGCTHVISGIKGAYFLLAYGQRLWVVNLPSPPAPPMGGGFQPVGFAVASMNLDGVIAAAG